MFSKSNKVKFQDQQLDDYVLENSVLKSKLQSKIDALSIMSNELDKCCMERDRYKMLVEQLKCKKHMQHNNNLDRFAPTNTISGSEILARTKESNNMLKLEYRQIQLDYRTTLDEKEELVSDRDYYKNKVQRLISQIFNNSAKTNSENSTPFVDVDTLLTENKYLHERITQLQVEKEIVKRTLTKYKTLLDNRNKSEPYIKKGFADVMTQKQVREYLDINSKTGLKRGSAQELKRICLGLFEALNDKSIALQHQRKTNQILANRITELEKTLESLCNGQKFVPIFPSQMLLDELNDTSSTKSDESRGRSGKRTENTRDEIKYTNSEDETAESKENLQEVTYYDGDNRKLTQKTVLPKELQDLVIEAAAEMRMQQK
ncbi:coiled-coil domain-containing protein 149-B [Danaus plexippus plexippus]|uniref:Coiled-coil domain-containing protein 149-B n=1 Tax=Danaus plexippus plexippus TaxID=278856 RepID=A0A212FGQ4_DANPL|nr:coiled-coil domain-containing protein 149-B [Danaus plexippus plexippus]